MRLRLSHWLMTSGTQLAFIGGLFVSLSILLITVTLRLDRRENYQLKMGFLGLAAEVDLDVVRSLTGRYWQTHFPLQFPCRSLFCARIKRSSFLSSCPKSQLTSKRSFCRRSRSIGPPVRPTPRVPPPLSPHRSLDIFRNPILIAKSALFPRLYLMRLLTDTIQVASSARRESA